MRSRSRDASCRSRSPTGKRAPLPAFGVPLAHLWPAAARAGRRRGCGRDRRSRCARARDRRRPDDDAGAPRRCRSAASRSSPPASAAVTMQSSAVPRSASTSTTSRCRQPSGKVCRRGSSRRLPVSAASACAFSSRRRASSARCAGSTRPSPSTACAGSASIASPVTCSGSCGAPPTAPAPYLATGASREAALAAADRAAAAIRFVTGRVEAVA